MTCSSQVRTIPPLHDAIKAISGYWAKPLESFWIVKANDSATKIRDKLLAHIEENDKLFVSTVGRSWAGRRLGKNVYDWLKDNWVSDPAMV